MTILVSACLLGFPCRYDGADKRDEHVLKTIQGEEMVPVCPEVSAGLGIPREPAWIDGGKIIDRAGRDVTAQFEEGARIAVKAAQNHTVRLAILKQNSPSCGTRMTGTSKGRMPGMGRAAAALKAAGFDVRGEDEL